MVDDQSGKAMDAAHNLGSVSAFDAIRRVDEHGEHWFARDLMAALDYESWRNFEGAIQRAEAAAANSGSTPGQFVQVAQVVAGGNLGPQTRSDYRMTRFGAYLLVMNGDPKQKPKVAEAQRYFAVKTREAETATAGQLEIPQTMGDALRLAAEQFDRAEAEKAGRELAEHRVAELEPAADSWETLANAHGDLSLRDAAQILSRDRDIEIGQNRLAKLLRELGWIDKKTKRPYQDQVKAGRLSAIVSHWTDEDGELHTKYLARVTAKGLEALRGHLNGSRALPIRFPRDDVWGEAS